MGIFDRAIKKGLGDAIGGAIGNKIVQTVEQKTGVDFSRNNQTVSSSDQQAAYQAASAPASMASATDKPYFRAIIQENFSNYTVREDVSVSEFGGEGKPYDFALFNHGECCGVVMLVAHNRDNNRAYNGAKAAAKARGVPFINFYTHMANERGFVFNRIQRLAKP